MNINKILDRMDAKFRSDKNQLIKSADKFRRPHIYLLINQGNVVYVGMSESNVLGRISAHLTDNNKDFDNFVYFRPPSCYPILDVEKAFISYFQPKYNIQGITRIATPTDFEVMGSFLAHFKLIDTEDSDNG